MRVSPADLRRSSPLRLTEYGHVGLESSVLMIVVAIITLVFMGGGVFSGFTHVSVPWLIAANSILFSLVLAIQGWAYYGPARLALNTPVTKIGDLESRRASVQGKVKPIDTILESPMSGSKCVYYHFTVVEQKGSGENSSSKTLVDEREVVPFQIVDDTGEMNVDLESAALNLSSIHASSKQRDLYNLRPQLRGKWGHPTTAATLRYKETVIRVSSELYVLGMVSSQPNCLPQFEKGKGPYLISDKPKDAVVTKGQLEGGLLLIAAGIFGIGGFIIPFIVPADIFKRVLSLFG